MSTSDLIGIGFGPANLAIAVALIDKWDALTSAGETELPIQSVCFIEKHEKFLWHPGMLLPGSQMQISFLKDLATLRTPTSSFTFLAFLHDQNRLLPFINRGSFTPTRREFSDYLAWAAQKVASHPRIQVFYGEDVLRIREGAGGVIEVVSSKNGQEIVRSGRNMVISPGGQARIPPPLVPFMPHPQMIHTSSYVSAIPSVFSSIAASSPGPRALKIAVVGSGQSAAEVFLDLRSRLADLPVPEGEAHHELDLIIRTGSLKPSDDSPFANEIFDPASTDFVFNLPSDAARQRVRAEYLATNYSVVNPRTLDSVYEAFYEQKIEIAASRTYNPRMTIRTYQAILSASTSANNQITLSLRNLLSPSHELDERTYDAVILGTGYQRDAWSRLLSTSPLGKHFGISNPPVAIPPTPADSPLGSGQTTPSSPVNDSIMGSAPRTTPNVTRAYRLIPEEGSVSTFTGGIYLQGCSEATHGLSDTLLSVLGVRSGEVVEDMFAHATKLELPRQPEGRSTTPDSEGKAERA